MTTSQHTATTSLERNTTMEATAVTSLWKDSLGRTRSSTTGVAVTFDLQAVDAIRLQLRIALDSIAWRYETRRPTEALLELAVALDVAAAQILAGDRA